MEVWELKLYFYPSAGRFKKNKKICSPLYYAQVDEVMYTILSFIESSTLCSSQQSPRRVIVLQTVSLTFQLGYALRVPICPDVSTLVLYMNIKNVIIFQYRVAEPIQHCLLFFFVIGEPARVVRGVTKEENCILFHDARHCAAVPHRSSHKNLSLGYPGDYKKFGNDYTEVRVAHTGSYLWLESGTKTAGHYRQ